jgi:hypothetical protein
MRPEAAQLVPEQLAVAAEMVGDHLRLRGDEAKQRVDHGSAMRGAAQ